MRIITILSLLLFSIACGNVKKNGNQKNYETISFCPRNQETGNSVHIYCYKPENFNPKSVSVQIIVPDKGECPAKTIEDWADKADKFGLLLVVPDFFYGNKPYDNSTYKKLFDVIDEIHKKVVAKYKLKGNKFNLCGNMEGGNFVNQYLLFHETPFLDKTVIAGVDWDQMPDFDRFRNENELSDIVLANYFDKKLAIFLTDKEPSSFEKGTDFFLSSRTCSQKINNQFNWALKFFYKSSCVGKSEAVAIADYLYGPYQNKHFTRGGGIEFYGSGPVFKNKTVPVFYYTPLGASVEKTNIQYVMHGMGRNGYDYLCSWINSANEYNLFMLVPQFSETDFSEKEYQQGGVCDNNGIYTDADSSTFELIEQIFAFVKKESPVDAEKYNIFGHSAGAQFVHRFLLFHTTPNLGEAISANAGWYTFPDKKYKFPYGLGTVPSRLNVNSTDYYGKNLTILLGTADTLRTTNLRQTPEADLQGLTRLQRGKTFYEYGKNEAQNKNCPFNWKLEFVEGVGHKGDKMSKAAAKYLYNQDK